METVGIIGLGAIGGGMARALVGRDVDVVGFDLDDDRLSAAADAGVHASVNIPDLCRRTRIVLVSVVAPAQLLAVATSVAEAGTPGLLVVDTSTVDPHTSAQARARLAAGGCRLPCAPVSGSAELARAGKLSAFCSGAPDDYRAAEPILDRIAASHRLIGDLEVARVAKLVINLVVLGTLELTAEALVLAEAQGLSRATAMDLIGSSVVDSAFLRYKTKALVEADYEPSATVSLVRKDLGLIASAAAEVGLDLPSAARSTPSTRR